MIGTEFAWAEEVSHLGVTAVLALAVAILWRSYQAAVKANNDYTREFSTHVAEMTQLPEAIDRLRTEVLSELRTWRPRA